MYSVEKATKHSLRGLPQAKYYVVDDTTAGGVRGIVRGCATLEIAMRVCKELNEKAKANKTA